MRVVSIITLFIGSLLGSVVLTAKAADTPSAVLKLEISPPVLELLTEPGRSISADVKVTNSGSATEALRVDLQKFSAQGEDGRPVFEDRASEDDYFDWVNFSVKEFTLLPNEQKTVTVTVSPPATAQFGYYLAVTFLRDTAESTLAESGATVTGGAATLILLNVQTPNAERSLDLLEFSSPRTVYEYLPATFTVRVKNTGNIHLAPRGAVFVRDSRGRTLSSVPLNPAQGNVLPGTNRAFLARWIDGFPLMENKQEGDQPITNAKGEPQQKLRWDLSRVANFRFGKYTARAVVVYNNGQRDVPLESFLSFWVIPWKALLVLGAIVLFVLLGLKSILWPLARLLRRKPLRSRPE
ncbi:hypothetical protein HY524_00185 [Candidatus Berkelbacteria bacterium]|nr:hypothetical protein [Candidatus Berkelbacteria bacterium]